MHWLWERVQSQWREPYFWVVLLLVGFWVSTIVWIYWSNVVGFLFKLAVKTLGRFVPSTNLKLYFQDDRILGQTDWGVQWEADGRHFFFFHDYMGWHNLSEGHRRDKCDDAAYCSWHGSL